MIETQWASVKVPASMANLGPGFDCLALAVSLYLRVEVETIDEGFEIEVDGVGSDEILRTPENLLFRSMARLFGEVGWEAPPLRVKIHNEVPLASGLGSSASAIVAGLQLANSLAGRPLDDGEAHRLATELEGHPDNVAASYYGGLTISAMHGDVPKVRKIPIEASHRVVAVYPPVVGKTKDMRSVLPASVSREDAVFNLANAAYLAAAFALGDWDGLRPCFEDRLHQETRSRVLTYVPKTIEAAYEAGAYGAFLSGSGPTVGAIASLERADAVARAMAKAVSEEMETDGVESFILSVDNEGAVTDRGPRPRLTPSAIEGTELPR